MPEGKAAVAHPENVRAPQNQPASALLTLQFTVIWGAGSMLDHD